MNRERRAIVEELRDVVVSSESARRFLNRNPSDNAVALLVEQSNTQERRLISELLESEEPEAEIPSPEGTVSHTLPRQQGPDLDTPYWVKSGRHG